MQGRKDLSEHILTASSTMAGACLTAVGLVKILEARTPFPYADRFLAADAVLFLVSVMLAYVAIRYAPARWARRCENLADSAFLVGMAAMGVILLVVVFDII